MLAGRIEPSGQSDSGSPAVGTSALIHYDVFALESFDVDHSLDEDRFVIIGKSERGRLLVVAFTLRDHTTIRIISAREALRQERLEYEKQIGSR